MSDTPNILVPVDWLPAGLITWYSREQRPVALATSWMSMVCGETSRLKAAWPGLRDPRAQGWPGGDFILNIPDEHCLPLIRQFVAAGSYCLDVASDLGQEVATGDYVNAPRLLDCSVQIECCNGRLDEEAFDAEITGDVLALHRWGTTLRPADVPDLCLLVPLKPVLPQSSLQ